LDTEKNLETGTAKTVRETLETTSSSEMQTIC